LHICKELGLTLGQLRREMTIEEVWLWITYFNLMNEEQEASLKKARKRR
jgi:citrate synthase